MANFDVTTEYAQSTSDTTAPTSGWSTTKPAPSEGYFVWARNIMNMGYGDIISEPYCIGDGLEHILSIDVEYIAWSDAYQSPPQSSEYWQTTAPSIQAGQYIWTRTKMVTTYGTNYTDPLRVTGIDGQDGADGQDGISIKGDDGKGFDFIYYTTDSATFNTTPTDDVVRTQNQYDRWCDSPTPVDATHQYIYMSLRTTDSNGDWGHWSSPVLMSSIGEKGEDGEGFEIIFTRTNSDSTVPTFSNGQGSSSYTGTDSQGRHYQDADFTPTGWTDNQQGVDSNHKYEWASFRFKTVTNGEASWGNFNTPKIWATFSEDGESSYIHIRYSSVNNPSDVNQTTTSPTSTTIYIGICVSNSSGEPSFNCYSWKKWIPEEGIDYDGKFLHMKYASDVTFNQDGSVNTVTFTGNNGEDAGEWLGTLFDYTVTDSTTGADYTWTKIEGNGISNIQEQYAMSTSYTIAPTTGWRNTPLENEVGKFYWTRNVISFTDGSTTTTNAICVSGADGDGVHNAYYCTDSLSTPNTPSFSDIHANSSIASQNYDKWVEDPVAIDSTHRYIYISTSTSYSYVSGVKVWNSFSEPVLWSRYALDGSDGTNGTNGTNGIGYEYAYYTSDSSTAPTKPSGNVTATSGTKKWTTVPIPMTSTYKYMYISYRTVQGSTKSTWSNSALWSQFGEKGDTGASGKDGLGMEHIFYLTNTEITDWDSVTGDTNPTNWTTQPTTDDYVKSGSGWSDDATGVDSTHKYEYCSIRRKEYDTDGKTAKWGAFSTPSLWAKFGEKGDKGDKGDVGDAGQGFEYVYKLNANDTTPTTPSGNITNTSTRGNWAKLPLDMGADYPYTFISYRTSDENGDWGSWTTPSLWSKLGEDGTGIYRLSDTITINTYENASYPNSKYRILKSDVTTDIGRTLVLDEQVIIGDYIYPIVLVGSSYYHLGEGTLLKGEQGVKGADGLGLEHIFCRTDKDGYIMTNEGSRLKRSNADVLLSSSTNSNPSRWTAQTTTDDYYNTAWGWYDNAQGVTEDIPYEYVAIRRKVYADDGKTALWGVFTDFKLWAKFGADGKSITSVVNYYVSNNSSTAPSKSATWYTDIGDVTFDETHKYLWNYEITYSGSTVVSETDPVAIAYWSEDGVAGKGISSVVEHYAVSSSNSTAPSSWQSTNDANFTMPVTTSTNKYLWNYETINFTTGNPYNSEKRVIGTHGEDGVSIGSVVNYYLASASSSGVTTSTSGWTPTVQATSSSKPYLWNYEIVKDVDGNTLSTTSPVIIANSSKSIKSITEYYCTSNSATAPADSSFSTTFVTTSPSSIYLWNYELITFYDNTTSATSKRIISTHGANGVDGEGEQFIFILTTEETIPSVPTSENQIVPATSQFITITGSVGSGSWTKGGVAYTKRVTKTTLGSSITPVVGDYVSKDTTIYYIGYVESTYVYLIELSSIWFDDPQDVDVTHPYQYITSRKFDTSTETWSEWSEPSLWNKYTSDGSQGEKGEDGSDGRDGTDITGEEIMQKLAGQKINATTIGGFEITDLMTTVLTNDTGAVYDAQNYGTYRIMKMGRLCLLVLRTYKFTFTSVGGHKIMFSIPTWAYPLSLMYLNSAPNLETISLGDEGCRVQSDGKSVGETAELSGVFVYFAKENVSLTGTSITINESSVMSSYPLTVTLKDANNNLLSDKSVEITVNGGTYTKKTTNGVASLNLNIGNGGTYGVDAKFNGDTAYANSTTSKSVSVTPCTNPSIIFDAQNKKAQIVNTISSVKTPIRGLSCIVKFNNDSTNMTTDNDGYLNFTTVLSQYSGTVKVTVTTNDANRCNSKSGSQSMSGGKTSETLTVASTPSEINSATDGRVWTGITPENLSSPWDGKYAKAYNIASGSNYATLDMLNSFNIPHTATVNKIKITFVYASLLGQTSLSKGNFPAPTISLTHTNNTQIINTVSIGQAISRTQCGNWYVAEQEWNLSASDGLNTDGKWNKIGIRLHSAQNGGGGYGNNASYGVDYLIVEVTYTT